MRRRPARKILSMKTVPVKVSWVPPEKGGRKAPPGGMGPYSTIARGPWDKPGESWSAVLWWDYEGARTGRMRFLVEEAPEEYLKAGTRCSLYEGPRKVADVEIGA